MDPYQVALQPQLSLTRTSFILAHPLPKFFDETFDRILLWLTCSILLHYVLSLLQSTASLPHGTLAKNPSSTISSVTLFQMLG